MNGYFFEQEPGGGYRYGRGRTVIGLVSTVRDAVLMIGVLEHIERGELTDYEG